MDFIALMDVPQVVSVTEVMVVILVMGMIAVINVDGFPAVCAAGVESCDCVFALTRHP